MADYLESPMANELPGDVDGRGSLAIAAGLGAAIAAGLIWAAIAILANVEIGWAAWGVGALVGGAMSRVTANRSKALGLTAAGLSMVAILLGKAFIFMGSTASLAEEIAGTPEFITGAAAWQMYDGRTLNPTTLDSLDAWQASGDTLSDALWAEMTSEATARLASMTEEEKLATAVFAAQATLDDIGLVGGVTGQLTAFDLLWFGLAVFTAYGMLARQKPAMRTDSEAVI